MNYFSIDYLIVYAFLAITLIIGVRSGRGIKDIREYAIANKTFGTGALVLTYLATNIAGASILNGTAHMFSQGIIYIIALFGLVIAFIVRAIWIAPKVANFKDCLTMGDLMERLYDKNSKIIAGILGFLTAICLAGMELTLLGFITENLLGIKASWAVVIGGILLAAYSAYGGIKSVTATDVFQFLIFIVIFPGIAYILLNKAGGIQEIFTHVPAEKFKILSHPNFFYYLTLFLMWSIFPVGMMDPAIIQRMLMAQNGKQLRDQYLVIAAFDPAFRLVLLIISFTALVLYPNLKAQQVVPHIIQVVLPLGMKGLAITSLLAINISSIDSYLHAAGLTFTHDVIQPLTEKRYAMNELQVVRYATVLISLIAIVIALHTTNTFQLLLNSLAFTGPLLMFPFLSGVMGLKTDKQSFYISLIATLISFELCKFLLPPTKSYLTTLISILTNGAVFFGMHAIKNKGFAMAYRMQTTIEVSTLWQPRKKTILKKLHELLPTPSKIATYSKNKVEKYGAPYTLFGFFFVINYLAPYFMWEHKGLNTYNLMLVIRIVGFFLCTLLIFREKWPKIYSRYLPTFWHLTVLYCLPFTNTILFLTTNNSIEQIANVSITAIFLIVLLDWTSFLLLSILGLVLGCFVIQHVMGSLSLQLDLSTQYFLVYQLIFITLIGLLFAKRKPKAISTGYVADRFARTFLGDQMEFILGATKRLADHLDMYMENTEKMWWNDTHDGFYTIYSYGMQTIEDPDLFELLIDILPSIKAMRDETKAAMQLLRTSVKSRMVATNLHLYNIKSFIVNGACEIEIDYPNYCCTIHQIIYRQHLDPILRIVTITPSAQHLHIRDYSDVLTEAEKMPLLQAFSDVKCTELAINNTKSYFKAIQQRIAEIKEGYKLYTLEFPNMELVA